VHDMPLDDTIATLIPAAFYSLLISSTTVVFAMPARPKIHTL
jgi:hypothetical protein